MNDGYKEILSSIASSKPTPGGGSVAALSLAHAYALSTMVARLTLAKEKWSDGHKVAEKAINSSEDSIEESVSLALLDSEAFERVMAAYRLPKSDDQEIEERRSAIRAATIGAAEAPLKTAETAANLLQLIESQSEFCNSNALTDLASAAELSFIAVIIASMNVKINLDFIKGDDVTKLTSEIEKTVEKSQATLDNIRSIVSERLGW